MNPALSPSQTKVFYIGANRQTEGRRPGDEGADQGVECVIVFGRHFAGFSVDLEPGAPVEEVINEAAEYLSALLSLVSSVS
jgi:hypothetical protein